MTELVSLQDQLIDAIADRVAHRMRQPPATIVVSTVDLASQVETYLAERGRAEATKVEIRRTLGWYFKCAEAAGLAYDSKQAAAAFKRLLQGRHIASQTINFHLGRVSQFLRWAESHGFLSADPVRAVKLPAPRDDEVTEKAINRTKLVALLRTQDTQTDGKAWLPWILSHSGARINEIASLYLENVKQDAETGIWYFEIDTKHEGQQVKNRQSRRRVPVHTKLLKLGLLDFVKECREAGYDRLFPCWSMSRPGKYAGAWLRPLLGATAHSIRHRVNTDLLRARMPEPEVNRLLGHQAYQSMAATYFAGFELAPLRDAIELLSYGD